MPSATDERTRRRILEQWRRSRLPSHEFARIVGVSHSTLYKWRREIRMPPAEAFVELIPHADGPAASSSAPVEGNASLEIVLRDGVVVRVRQGVDEALLRRVIETLS